MQLSSRRSLHRVGKRLRDDATLVALHQRANPAWLAQMARRSLLAELERWHRTPYAVQVRYEALRAQPVAVLAELTERLALPVNRRQIEAIVARHDFARVTGRSPGQEADAATRKGIVGDWRTYFTAETLACFRTAQDGRWYDLLLEMNYDW